MSGWLFGPLFACDHYYCHFALAVSQHWQALGSIGTDTSRCSSPSCIVFLFVFFLSFVCLLGTCALQIISLSLFYVQWYPEIRNHDGYVPVVLVGTKLDLRQDKTAVQQLKQKTKQTPVSHSQGSELARTIKAKGYFECSSRTQENLKTVFLETVRVALNMESSKPQSRRKCVVL